MAIKNAPGKSEAVALVFEFHHFWRLRLVSKACGTSLPSLQDECSNANIFICQRCVNNRVVCLSRQQGEHGSIALSCTKSANLPAFRFGFSRISIFHLFLPFLKCGTRLPQCIVHLQLCFNSSHNLCACLLLSILPKTSLYVAGTGSAAYKRFSRWPPF